MNPHWPYQTYVVLTGSALIAVGFIALAGWPASVILLGIALLVLAGGGLFN